MILLPQHIRIRWCSHKTMGIMTKLSKRFRQKVSSQSFVASMPSFTTINRFINTTHTNPSKEVITIARIDDQATQSGLIASSTKPILFTTLKYILTFITINKSLNRFVIFHCTKIIMYHKINQDYPSHSFAWLHLCLYSGSISLLLACFLQKSEAPNQL